MFTVNETVNELKLPFKYDINWHNEWGENCITCCIYTNKQGLLSRQVFFCKINDKIEIIEKGVISLHDKRSYSRNKSLPKEFIEFIKQGGRFT